MGGVRWRESAAFVPHTHTAIRYTGTALFGTLYKVLPSPACFRYCNLAVRVARSRLFRDSRQRDFAPTFGAVSGRTPRGVG